MTTAIEKLGELKARREALDKEILDEGKALFRVASSDLFAKHSVLVSFSWTQYQPHWNDGDECVFSAHTKYIKLRTSDEAPVDEDRDEDDDEDDDEEDEFSKSDLLDYTPDWKSSPKASLTPREAAGKDVLEFLGNFDDDNFKEMFGNHMRIIVTKEGVEAEEYDHD